MLASVMRFLFFKKNNNNNFKHVGFNGLWELNFLEDDNDLEYGLCVSLGMRL